MDKKAAQEVVRRYLGDSDRNEFNALVEEMKNPDLITQEELTEASVKLTELFDRNSIQIIAQPNRSINKEGFSPMELHVLHKGQEVT